MLSLQAHGCQKGEEVAATLPIPSQTFSKVTAPPLGWVGGKSLEISPGVGKSILPKDEFAEMKTSVIVFSSKLP